MGKSTLFAVLLVAALCAATAYAAGEPKVEQFWTQYRSNLASDEGLAETIAFFDLCRDAGLTHLVLTEQSMSRWDVIDDAYVARITACHKAAEERGITIVPSLFPIGYGGRYLFHDVNLAAGLPARDVPFMVRGGVAVPDPAAVPALMNADFEDADGDRLAGWTQDAPGERTFVDRDTKRSGNASLRITGGAETPPAPGQRGPGGPAAQARSESRVTQTVAVEPFKYYRLSLWARTDNAGSQGETLVQIWSNDRRRRNTYFTIDVKSTQDWTRHSTVFNTLDAQSVDISIGAGRLSGAVWIDAVEIEPAGILNVIRRDLAPLSVTSDDGATVYEEGRDFEKVFDPVFAERRNARIDHAPAPIALAPGSRIREGDRLLVSYYHTMRIYVDQVVLTLSDPAMFEMMDAHMAHIAKYWPAPMYFSTADEIRIAGWELQPDGENLTVAQMLARYMRRSDEIMKKYLPEARLVVWSDMFTPFHNGRPLEERGPYYLCTGGFYGSWNGLARDILIANWNGRNRLSTVWFEVLGHEQIMCGYYDTNDIKANIARWMRVSRHVDGVVGMMYTQWTTGHERMKEFFQLTRDYPAWLEEGHEQRAIVRER